MTNMLIYAENQHNDTKRETTAMKEFEARIVLS